MTKITVTIQAEIIPEDAKYCDGQCFYLDGQEKVIDFDPPHQRVVGPFECSLFRVAIGRCLGGGPIRCAACLEAEKNTKETKAMKKVIVVDLDGTLADVSKRTELVRSDKPKWDEFYARVAEDKVNVWCRELMAAMWAFNHDVIIVSARPQRCMGDTREWLRVNLVSYTGIFLLRGADKDYTPDVDLKRSWLKNFGKERILFAVDDRQRVVDMWRAEGITCLQCAAWEEFKRSKK